jgi:ribosomal protein L7/L12
MSQLIRQRIAARAYQYFLDRGGAHGHQVEDWLRAEKDLTGTPYDIILTEPGTSTIELVRAIRDLTDLGLPEIWTGIASVPWTVKRVASLVEAESFRAVLEPLGARVELRAVE